MYPNCMLMQSLVGFLQAIRQFHELMLMVWDDITTIIGVPKHMVAALFVLLIPSRCVVCSQRHSVLVAYITQSAIEKNKSIAHHW